nr:helix-turn-helix transcriptional regulator [Micromonospora sp. DSM 115978]
MADTNEFRHLLRKLRMERGMSQDAVGAEVHVTGSQIGHYESGRSVPGDDMADALDRILNAGGKLRAAAEQSRGEAVAPWLRPWRDNERRAAVLRWWEPTLIPGLLQTEEYARAVISAGQHTPDQIEEAVRIRLDRQADALDRANPVVLSAIIGEPALRYGAPTLMKNQLSHLLDMAQRPNIIVRVLPFGAGVHAGQGGAYALATLPDGSATGYADDPLEGKVVKAARDLIRLTANWEAVSARALSWRRSQLLIQRMINEHERRATMAEVDQEQ